MEHKIWITSDLHFGHDKDFIYQARSYKSIAEHDREIIKNWNELVSPEDEVFILGDLMLTTDGYGLDCIHQLNGHLNIICGNHDSTNRRKLYFMECENVDSVFFAQQIEYKKYTFFLSHYPTLVNNYDNYLKIWNLHGHTHSTEKFSEHYHCYNVALDAHDNKPVLLDDIIEDIKNFNNNLNKEEK